MPTRTYRPKPQDFLSGLAWTCSQGFNGELADPLTGHYLLGNGYRAFNPLSGRFNSPDSLSPFGKGGFNAYAYCQGDPVNRRDPSGHADFFGEFWRDALPILGMVVPFITSGVLYKFTKPRISKLLAGKGTASDRLVVGGSAAVAASAIVGVAGTAVRYAEPQSNVGHALGALALVGTGAFSLVRYAGLRVGKVVAMPASRPMAGLAVRGSITTRSAEELSRTAALIRQTMRFETAV